MTTHPRITVEMVARGWATPTEVIAARAAAGDTQAAAADRIWVCPKTWSNYERGERRMLLAAFELYLLKTHG